MTAWDEAGLALNPVSVEGQIIGSVWMGMGQALTEEMVWKDGLLMNPGLLEYRSPSSVESPEIEPIIVESIDPEGPFGAKECASAARFWRGGQTARGDRSEGGRNRRHSTRNKMEGALTRPDVGLTHCPKLAILLGLR